MYKKSCCLTIVLMMYAALTACSGSGSIVRSITPPDWTLGESSKYPTALYVTATGSATDPEAAKDRAMGNLSKVFEAHIVGSTSTSSDTQSKVSSSREEVSSKQRLVQRINVHSEQVLEGIQIAEQWQNTADLTYYALAVIDRKHVGNILKDEIKRLDKDTEFELDAIGSQKDDLKRVAAYQRVIELQETRNNFQKMLKVIDLKGFGVKPKWSLVELKAFSASALEEIRISVNVYPQGINGLKQQLQAAMSHAGFPAVKAKADYTLLAEVNLHDPEEKQGWYWQRGTLEIRLIDALSGVTRGSHSWDLKASATEKSQLLARFKQAIDKSLRAELKGVLIDIADAK